MKNTDAKLAASLAQLMLKVADIVLMERRITGEKTDIAIAQALTAAVFVAGEHSSSIPPAVIGALVETGLKLGIMDLVDIEAIVSTFTKRVDGPTA